MARRLRLPGPRELLMWAAPCIAALGLVLVTSSCGSRVAGRGGPSIHQDLSRSAPVAQTVKAPSAVHAVRAASAAQAMHAVRSVPAAQVAVLLSAWKKEISAFFTASGRGGLATRLLASDVVTGSPEDEQMTAYLSAQAASGVVGPTTWRLGGTHVVWFRPPRAEVSGCSFDPGSHFEAGGPRVPPSLGGGAGLTAYVSDMLEVSGKWKLVRSATSTPESNLGPGPCHGFGVRLLSDRGLAGNGGGVGSSGSSIWSWVWWLGNPQGPGPYTGRDTGGAGVCVWHDIGQTLKALNEALAGAGLPAMFWDSLQNSAHPGIWGVDFWGAHLLEHAAAWDHFDLVACPEMNQVPPTGDAVQSGLPPARMPSGKVMHLWIFWDTVPDPPVSELPPLIHEALAGARLPIPVISTSPSSIDEFGDATIVNFPTWLWIQPSAWRTIRATAAGSGLVATVWATPMRVIWRTAWDFPTPKDDPEGGVTLAPETVDLVCRGPGQPYVGSLGASAQSSACESIFTESTFGTYQPLGATISWQVHWALSDYSGVVGGEGLFGDSATTGTRPLRVLQVESVITQG